MPPNPMIIGALISQPIHSTSTPPTPPTIIIINYLFQMNMFVVYSLTIVRIYMYVPNGNGVEGWSIDKQ